MYKYKNKRVKEIIKCIEDELGIEFNEKNPLINKEDVIKLLEGIRELKLERSVS